MIDAEVIENMPFGDYQAVPALNFSSLKLIDDCPETLQNSLNRWDSDDEPSDDTIFGRAYHTYVLEPKSFKKFFAICPKMVRKGKEWEAIVLAARGRTILWEEELVQLGMMQARLRKHAMIPGLMSGAHRELSIFWHKGAGQIPCKARIDIYNKASCILSDLKTTRSAHPKFFQNEIVNRNYYAQLAWYREALLAHGLPVEHVVIVAQGKTEPFYPAFFKIPGHVLDFGLMENELRFRKYEECVKNNNFPGYPEKLFTVNIPPYKTKEILEGKI